MEHGIAGLNVLITGASRGIGKAVALELARHGARLSLVARDAKALEALGEAVAGAGAHAVALPVDLTHPDAPATIVGQTVEHLGGLDVLINNAGAAVSRAFADTTLEEWRLVMELNARVPYFLSQAALPHLRASAAGTIINISSVVGRKGYVNQSAYGASKHALVGLSKALARELQSDGIRVHVIAPGSVSTEMITSMRPDIDPKELIAPQEVAELVSFLLMHRGNGVIDEINIRRATGTPWQ